MNKKWNKLLVSTLILTLGITSACEKRTSDSSSLSNSSNEEASSEISSSSENIELEENSSIVWLDRYEEADIKLACGDISKLTCTSLDTSIATVENGRIIAQGKGETDVEVTNGVTTLKIHVKVRDSLVKPFIAFSSLEGYVGIESDVPQQVSYNGKLLDTKIDYEITIADTTIATYASNKITGLKLGETTASVSASYKGLTLTKQDVKIEVRPLLYITVASDTISLYNVESKLGRQDLSSAVFEKGEEIIDAAINYSIKSGSEFIRIVDGKVEALAEGEAIIEAFYEKNGNRVSKEITVTVSPNWMETHFDNPSPKPIVFEKTTATIGGRTGDISLYKADPNVTGNDCWENHIVETRKNTKIVDLYREGKKYFAYDLYYTSNQNLMIGCSDKTSWISVGDYFRKDYIKIYKDGKMTNTLEKNCWVTIVYDLKELWMLNMGMSSYFFFFVNDGTSTQYLMNERYYLDDSFLPNENLAYEDKGSYTQATNDEFDVMVPVSKSYSMATGQPSLVIKPEEVPTYVATTETVGGRTSAYEYKTKIASAYNNSLVVAKSMNESYDDSMYKMSKLGDFYTFDIYPTKNSTLTFRTNGGFDPYSVNAKVGVTNLGGYEDWLIILKDNKKQNMLTANEWQTVVIAFADNYNDKYASAYISFSANEANDTVYVDNCRYQKDNTFIPAEYVEEAKRPIINSSITTASVEKVREGDFRGSYKYENTTSNSKDSAIYFNDVTTLDNKTGSFFADNYAYVKFELFLSNNITSVSFISTADKNFDAFIYEDIKIGQTFTQDMYAYSLEGNRVNQFNKNTWYTVYLPVSYSSLDVGNAKVCMYTNGGTASSPAISYIRYITFEYELNTLFIRDNVGGISENISLEYQTEGEFAGSYQYINKTSGELSGFNQNFGESGVRFTNVTASDDGSSGPFFVDGYKWISVNIYVAENVQSISIRVNGDRNLTTYWEKDVKIGATFGGHTMYVIDMNDKRATKINRNTWYTIYIPVEYSSADTGWTTVNVYSNGGSIQAPAVMYMNNVQFLKEIDLPEVEPYDVLSRTDYVEEVSIDKLDDESYKYVNATSGSDSGNKQNWGESGIFFNGVTNPVANTAAESAGEFFADGYHWIKVDVNVERASSFSIKVLGQTGLTQYYPQSIQLDTPIVNGYETYVVDTNGSRVNQINKGEWYTIYIPVMYEAGYDNWTDILIYTNGGSVANPSIMYFKNIEFLKEVTIPSLEVEEKVMDVRTDYGSLVSCEKLENDIYKYTNKTCGSNPGINTNYGQSGIYFKDVTNPLADTATESTGKFFEEGYHWIKIDLKVENLDSFSIRVFGQDGLSTYFPENIKVGQKFPTNFAVYAYNMDGTKVDSIEADVWYTFYIQVDYVAGYDNWTDVLIYSNGGSEQNPSIMYLSNLEFLKTFSA